MIDSHCHLDHVPLVDNLKHVVERSKEAGLEKLLTISTTLDSFETILKTSDIKILNIITGIRKSLILDFDLKIY